MTVPARGVDDRGDLVRYRRLFPVTDRFAYLDHGQQGTVPAPTVEAVTRVLRQQSTEGSVAREGWNEMRQRTRAKMARFVGAQPSEMAFTRNTADGIDLVATGIEWKAGDEVVTADLEFPCNVYPWTRLKDRGVRVRIVRSEAGRIPPQAVLDSFSEHTRLVCLSWVEFTNGFRNDIEAIGAACRRRGILFCVDAMQGLGALRLDVSQMDIDCFAASSHKWLLAPAGVGWFYCRQDLIPQLDVAWVGQSSYERGRETSWLDYGLGLWDDSRRFEPGVDNHAGIAGLEASLDLLAEVGIDRIERRIHDLGDLLADGIQRKGLNVVSPRGDREWSGLVSFTSPNEASATVFERLRDAGVIVSLREGLVRVAPHFYNNETDIERLLEALG